VKLSSHFENAPDPQTQKAGRKKNQQQKQQQQKNLPYILQLKLQNTGRSIDQC
jgi:hypothetical protein